MADQHANFAYSTITGTTTNNGSNPGTSGTSITVANASLFPTPPFNATVWPVGSQPLRTGNTSTSAEIVRVNSVATNTFSVTRQAEGSDSRNILNGDQIAATITAQTLTDIEGNYANSWTPFELQTGTALQTLNNSSGSSSTGSLLVFPVTFQAPVKFNQVMVAQSLSYVLSALTTTVNNSYYSHFGIYSLYSSTLLSLISSNSFSIGETLSLSSTSNVTVSWNYPTTTATSVTTNGSAVGYGYGPFQIPGSSYASATGGISSYISGTRIVGLQFANELSLSGGQYWIGLMSMRSTAVSSIAGLSQAGVYGQIVNGINQPGTAAGLRPLGFGPGDFGNYVSTNTGWFGRHIVGFVTATSLPNFLGTHLPDNITISEIGGVASVVSVLPAVTFVST